MPNYGDIAYWNKRYKEQAGTTYDWLLNYEHFRDIIKQYVLKPKLEKKLEDLEKKHKKLSDQADVQKITP
jgi:transcription initiation factor IIE alpha subunit